MSRIPEHRYLAVAEHEEIGDAAFEDPRMQSLAELLTTGSCADTDVVYAYELRAVEEHRATLDAFLLSGTPLSTISSLLAIPESVLAAYTHLFLDVSVFRNRLEILTYAANYRGSDHSKETVRAAVTVGPEYLLWAYGATGDLDPHHVVRRTMTDAFYRSMAHKGNAITSKTAQEAFKWGNMAVRNAELLEKLDPRTTRAAHEELRIALQVHDDTLTPDEAPVPLEEILH